MQLSPSACPNQSINPIRKQEHEHKKPYDPLQNIKQSYKPNSQTNEQTNKQTPTQYPPFSIII